MHVPFVVWPVVMLVVMAGQRLFELYLSARHLPYLRERGGREYGATHFPFLVAVHLFFFVVFPVELARHPLHVDRWWPLWLGIWAVAQTLRYAAIHALGSRWSVRVFVIPGLPPIKSGVYRWLRHPNYLAVSMEFVAAPMLFGAWRTAVVIGGLNALVLSVRIRCENDALRRAAS